MELYLFHQEKFQQHYNCSFYSLDAVPLAERRHLLLGAGLIALSTVFELLYLPCMVVLWRHRHQSSCHKFMLFIGVADVCCMPVNGLLSGVFAMQGAVYCTYPTLQLYAGLSTNLFWRSESTAAVCLALNRCVEMASPQRWSRRFFAGWRAWAWLLAIFLYSMGHVVFSKPSFFSAIYVGWFFDPHVGYFEDKEGRYDCVEHLLHNLLLPITICGFYGTFAALIMSRRRQASADFNPRLNATNLNNHNHSHHHHHHSTQFHVNPQDRNIFVQVALISALNGITGAIYAFMQYFPNQIGRWTIYAVSYLWLMVHGLPAVIYLVMNKTIRRECAEMVDSWVEGVMKLCRYLTKANRRDSAQSGDSDQLGNGGFAGYRCKYRAINTERSNNLRSVSPCLLSQPTELF